MKNEMHKTRVIKYILDRNPYAFNFDFFKSQLVDLGYKNIPEDLLLNFLNKNEVNYKKFIVEVLPCFLKEESKSEAVKAFLEKTKVSLDEFNIILAEAKFQDKQHIYTNKSKLRISKHLKIIIYA